ncbi:site-2 protease family protein [Solihabitans fulvus]|uniref:Site-2 protease family protein n=1 Tax=Solihabitans fulvus TaxID=1892852 RepID=A0A5B2XCC6_9PSEU|nr:site-2 protease family protein [Solihabitans fulvus]KAA2260933.1 site-2 protease family protein [Solihabitans fulvus]
MNRSAVLPSPLFLGILAATIVGGVLTVQTPLTVITIGTVLVVLGGWAVSLCLHEFGHAFVAYRGGDRSVRAKGYLTLDIRHYTDPLFSIVIPIVLLMAGGIPLPGGAVWINHYALRTKRIESAVSLAGPLSNLVLGALLATAVRAFDPPVGLAAALSYLALLQIFAFVLNILPVPGLDGFGAIEPFLSPQAQAFGAKARQWAPLILFALLIGVPPIRSLFSTITETVFGWVGGDDIAAYFGRVTFTFWQR